MQIIPKLLFILSKYLRKLLRINEKYLDGYKYSIHESEKASSFDGKFGSIIYKDRIIIDIGCGFGGSLLHMLHQGAHLCYGIEYDSARTLTAARYLSSKDRYQGKYLVANADARELPIKKNSVDMVISDAAFEHIAGLEKVISEIYRVMKPGGKAYFSCGSTWLTYNGGHLWTYIPIPWVHLLFSKKTIIATLKMFYGVDDINYPASRIDNIVDLYETLCCLTVRKLRTILRKSAFQSYSIFQYSKRAWKKSIDKIPILNELFAGSICCVLEK